MFDSRSMESSSGGAERVSVAPGVPVLREALASRGWPGGDAVPGRGRGGPRASWVPGLPGFPAFRASRLSWVPGFPAFLASGLSWVPGFPGFPAFVVVPGLPALVGFPGCVGCPRSRVSGLPRSRASGPRVSVGSPCFLGEVPRAPEPRGRGPRAWCSRVFPSGLGRRGQGQVHRREVGDREQLGHGLQCAALLRLQLAHGSVVAEGQLPGRRVGAEASRRAVPEQDDPGPQRLALVDPVAEEVVGVRARREVTGEERAVRGQRLG
ncbi:hypothetical protein SGRI78S_05881 [Streptomyces griseus subsp. griseus]